MKTMMIRTLGAVLALTLSIPAVAASQERAGIATTVVGPVTVTHVSMPPAPLNFKDDVLLNDRIATGEKAFARVLLGGKAVVTAREHSVITITETPGTSTIDLLSGRVSVNVDKSKMRAGDLVQVKTPNAVAGIRGTIVVAEAKKNVSTITVLQGLVDVYRRDPTTGNAFGPAVPVGVREAITVSANVLPARPQPISADNARQISNDFTPPVRPILVDKTIITDEVTRATNLIRALVPAETPASKDAAPSRDALTSKGETGDKTDKLDKADKLDRADKLDKAADRLERLTDRLDRAGDKLDKNDKLDRAGDRLDRADKLDKADKGLDRGMATVPGGGSLATPTNALPAAGNALPVTNTLTTPTTPPATGGMPTNSLPAVRMPGTVPATMPSAPIITIVAPTVTPTVQPMPPVPVVPHNFNQNHNFNYKFKK